MKREEIYSLTGLRGVAALMVMFYHFRLQYWVPGVGGRMLTHGYLMVDLFLVLSGFIIAMTYGKRFEQTVSWQEYKGFLLRRIARIYPLYVVMTIAAGILIATGWMDRWPGPEIPVSALINMTMLQSMVHVPSLDAPGWSVSAEWVANLLFPLFTLILLRRSWFWVGLAVVASFGTLHFLTMLPNMPGVPRSGQLDIWHYITNYPVARCVADFVLGIVVFRVWQLKWVKNIFAFNWIAPALFCVILVLMSIKQSDVFIVGAFVLLVLALIPNTNLISRFMGSKPIYRLGEISYSIYLFHNLMNYFMLDLANKLQELGLNQVAAHIIAIFIFAGIVIVIADCTYRFIEKPARNQINSLIGKKTNKPTIATIVGETA